MLPELLNRVPFARLHRFPRLTFPAAFPSRGERTDKDVSIRENAALHLVGFGEATAGPSGDV